MISPQARKMWSLLGVVDCVVQLVVGTIGCRMVETVLKHYTVPFAPLMESMCPSSISTVYSRFHIHRTMVANLSHRQSTEPSVAPIEGGSNPFFEGKTAPWRSGYTRAFAWQD